MVRRRRRGGGKQAPGTITVPAACPRCKGSGQVFVWIREAPSGVIYKHWRLFHGMGFHRVDCWTCHGWGTLMREPAPHADPTEWPHRVPEGTVRK